MTVRRGVKILVGDAQIQLWIRDVHGMSLLGVEECADDAPGAAVRLMVGRDMLPIVDAHYGSVTAWIDVQRRHADADPPAPQIEINEDLEGSVTHGT